MFVSLLYHLRNLPH